MPGFTNTQRDILCTGTGMTNPLLSHIYYPRYIGTRTYCTDSPKVRRPQRIAHGHRYILKRMFSMYESMYVCTHVCMYIYSHVFMHSSTYACIYWHVFMHACMHVYMFLCIYVFIYEYLYHVCMSFFD